MSGLDTKTEQPVTEWEIPTPKVSFYTKYVKRFLDIILSGMAIIVLSPVNVMKLESCFRPLTE